MKFYGIGILGDPDDDPVHRRRYRATKGTLWLFIRPIRLCSKLQLCAVGGMEEFRCWTWLWSWLWTLVGLNEVNGARDWRDSFG